MLPFLEDQTPTFPPAEPRSQCKYANPCQDHRMTNEPVQPVVEEVVGAVVEEAVGAVD
jgi:hypothetical protein